MKRGSCKIAVQNDIPGYEIFPEVGYRKTQSLKELVIKVEFSSDVEIPTSRLKGH